MQQMVQSMIVKPTWERSQSLNWTGLGWSYSWSWKWRWGRSGAFVFVIG